MKFALYSRDQKDVADLPDNRSLFSRSYLNQMIKINTVQRIIGIVLYNLSIKVKEVNSNEYE